MEAGSLRESITIKQRVSTQDGYGAVADTWSTVCTTRASFSPLAGREYFFARQMNSPAEAKFTIRYRAGINEDMRIAHRGSDYHIISVVNVGGIRKELLMYCRKVEA